MRLLLAFLLSSFLYASTPILIGVQSQNSIIGGNLSIPIFTVSDSSSGIHLAAVLKNKELDVYTGDEQPVYESYQIGPYVDFGKGFISIGGERLQTKNIIMAPSPVNPTAIYTETSKNGVYGKIGIHGKYVGIFGGYGSTSKTSFGVFVVISF